MTPASKPTAQAMPAADKNLPKLKDDRLADIVAQNAAFVVHVDARGRLLATAESTVALLGYPAAYLAQVSLQDLVMPEHVRELEDLMARVSSTGEPQKAVIPFLRADEGCYWLDLSIQSAQGSDGKDEPRFDVFGYDVTSWVRKERQLRDESRRDPLTGMSNRAHLREWMIESIDNGVASGKAFAVMMLDLDGFKRINDSLGHDIGDALLRAVGKRLKAQLHQDDVFARLGADEFVLVAGNLDESDTWDRLAARIVAAMQRPFSVGGQQLRVTFSIGIALYPEDGLKSSQLLKHADLAMYSAKDRGKNQFVFYSSDLEKVKAEAFSLEQDMLSGIRTGEFELHYQPIVDARTREVLAAEALMRWNHPQGQRPPTAFIPLAEDNGLINLLGSWALRMVCAQLARWDANGISLAYVGVNVSPVQFQNPAFSQSVMSAVRESGIDPGRLVLEITEGTLIKNPEQTEAILSRLHAFGVRFAIDDFGTGYSNLSYLRRFPISEIKIDRSFVSDILESGHDRAIVSAMLSLARELDLSVVAEGVETEEQLAILVERECQYIQGWLFSKALPPEDFEHFVATQVVISLKGRGRGSLFRIF